MEKDDHSANNRPPVIFIPGGVTPAGISYAPLLNFLKDQIKPVLKDLELYADDAPAENYDLQMEVDGIKRDADALGFKSFHLVGYSGGGAVSLAFAAQNPERLKSLALIEPAWIGNDNWTSEDIADWAELDLAMSLPEEERMPAFAQWHMRPGIQPPRMQFPVGGPPPWMVKRPAGLNALSTAFKAYHLNREKFRKFHQPAYYALGGLSRQFFERNARTLAGFFPNLEVDIFKNCSHFDPPHRAEPERFARAMLKLWALT